MEQQSSCELSNVTKSEVSYFDPYHEYDPEERESSVFTSSYGSTSSKSVRFSDTFPPNPTLRNESASLSDMLINKKCLKPFEGVNDKHRLQQLEEQQQSFLDQYLTNTVSVIKSDRRGRRKLRMVWISEDGTELCWTKSERRKKLGMVTRMALASVIKIILGPRSGSLSRFDWSSKAPENCICLVTLDRVLGLEFKGLHDYVPWVLGIQSLIPLTSRVYSRAQLHWHRLYCKLKKLSLSSNLPMHELVNVLSNHSGEYFIA